VNITSPYISREYDNRVYLQRPIRRIKKRPGWPDGGLAELANPTGCGGYGGD
jgi:hypothetical protein